MIKKLLLIINAIRTVPIVYNYTLHSYLRNNIPNNLYNDSFIEPYNFLNRTIALTGTDYKPLGAHYLLRDTMDKSMLKIFRFRINQEHCFDFNNCSNTSFNFFTSCLKTFNEVFENQKPCSWAYAYFPLLKHPKLTYISCVITNQQGRYVPESLFNKQKKSFWCYSNFNFKDLKNDSIK